MLIYINPGSGRCEEGSQEQSEINIKAFIADIEDKYTYPKISYKFVEINENGRHDYLLTSGEKSEIVAMPAFPLEEVRYTGADNQNTRDFPRLYVNHCSWLWKFAVDVIFNP